MAQVVLRDYPGRKPGKWQKTEVRSEESEGLGISDQFDRALGVESGPDRIVVLSSAFCPFCRFFPGKTLRDGPGENQRNWQKTEDRRQNDDHNRLKIIDPAPIGAIRDLTLKFCGSGL